jgi:hypothetical protein
VAIEAAVWVILGLGGSVIAGRVSGPSLESPREFPWGLRAAAGILPTALAWIRGAVSGRDLGLYGPSVNVLAGGMLLIASAFLALEFDLRRRSPEAARLPWLGKPVPIDLFDTLRWALYRAGGILWAGGSLLGTLVGWGLAVGESVVRQGRGFSFQLAEVRGRLIWLTLSLAILAVTDSMWLVLAAQASVLLLRRRVAP